MASKVCSKCRRLKHLTEFHRSSTNNDGHTSRCKPCRSEETRAYQERRRYAEQAAEERWDQLRAEGVELAE